MPLITLAKYSDIFVETGTLHGDGVQVALNAGYNKIISIEITDKFYNYGTQRFISNSNVKIVKGDSALVLGDIIKDINEPITFWLDGHYCGGDTGYKGKEYPLLLELGHILKHPIKTHNLLIDDIRIWKNYSNSLNMELVIKAIRSINSNYTLSFLDGIDRNDILMARLL